MLCKRFTENDKIQKPCNAQTTQNTVVSCYLSVTTGINFLLISLTPLIYVHWKLVVLTANYWLS